MKKALFVIATLALCMSANAKYWFGGTVGFDNKSFYDTDKNRGSLVIAPSVGMAFEDNLELGLDLEIANYTNIAAYKSKQFWLSFAPYLRYTFLTEGDFNLFVQGGVEYGIVSPEGNNAWHFTFQIQPGIRYMMSDHWSAVATLNGFYFTHCNDPEDAYNTPNTFKNNVGFGIDFSALKLGLVYEF